MAQTKPKYVNATGKYEKIIIDKLIEKYDKSNVIWPIVLSEEESTIAYYYERNMNNTLNLETDIRPVSKSNLISYYLDYTKKSRESLPKNNLFDEFLDTKYSCSYKYILDSSYTTVDLDYVWHNGQGFKGFEFTTFWKEFTSQKVAEDLISKMNRRPSWQGPEGARAFHKIVDSAADLGVDYYVVCANTVSNVGSELKINGNVCFFQLTHAQVELIQSGQPPINTLFMSFDDFLKWL